MPQLESIARRTFPEPDRAALQERIAQHVQRDPELFLARYVADPRSFAGRYVNSDVMKESFEEYRQSPEARNRYNPPSTTPPPSLPPNNTAAPSPIAPIQLATRRSS
jgi:hypothetical protein